MAAESCGPAARHRDASRSVGRDSASPSSSMLGGGDGDADATRSQSVASVDTTAGMLASLSRVSRVAETTASSGFTMPSRDTSAAVAAASSAKARYNAATASRSVASLPRANEFDLPGRLFGTRPADAPLTATLTGSSNVGHAPKSMTAANASSSTTVPRSLPRLDGLSPGFGDVGMPSADMTRACPATLASARDERDGVPAGDGGGGELSDAAFASEVLFMWMGVAQTAVLRYDETAHRYVMASGVGSPVQRSAFAQFSELGAFARQLVLELRADTATFFLQQSLHSALRRQLTQYHYLLASLRESRASSLTLGDLVVVYKRVRPKLCAMHELLRATQEAKGGELVSRLQRLQQQGSRRVHALLSDVYVETVSPLLHMVMCCITLGEVSDPYNELFIVADDRVDDASDRFWTSRFALRIDMLPSTIPVAVAEDVLLATKNIAFIRGCCRPEHWCMDASVTTAQVSFATLPGIVRSAVVYSNTAVLRFVREQYHLDAFFDLVNAFLLVGYGDFFELLIAKLTPILDKLSQSISVSYVRDEVNSALLAIAPYARHLDTNLFSVLHCELIKDEATLGWDAFVLTMPASSPLNNVFDLHATKVYRRLFRLLFKVKVAEVALKNAWRQNVVNDRTLNGMTATARGDVAAWRKVAADAHLLGLQLNHFVINLWSYLLSEVSSVASDTLRKAIERCQSFDDVRLAHGAYMTFLTKRCLLHTECTSMRMNIENILMIVREFCASQALLTSLLDRGAGEVQVIEQQYQTLTDDFHREMASLLSALEEQHQQFDFLNFLLLRINFNYYYRETECDESVEY